MATKQELKNMFQTGAHVTQSALHTLIDETAHHIELQETITRPLAVTYLYEDPSDNETVVEEKLSVIARRYSIGRKFFYRLNIMVNPDKLDFPEEQVLCPQATLPSGTAPYALRVEFASTADFPELARLNYSRTMFESLQYLNNQGGWRSTDKVTGTILCDKDAGIALDGGTQHNWNENWATPLDALTFANDPEGGYEMFTHTRFERAIYREGDDQTV